MEIPESAKKEAQIKYEKKIRDVVGKVFPIFFEEKLTVNDINNVVRIIQSEMTEAVARMELGDVIEKTVPKK